MSKKRFNLPAKLSAVVLASCIGIAGVSHFAQAQQRQNNQNNQVEVLHVRGPIFMISAGGSNIAASIGPDGVLLVDTGPAELSDKVKAAIGDVQKQITMARALMATPPVGGAETRSATQTALYTYGTP